jgi:cyclohexanone monooxygenase
MGSGRQCSRVASPISHENKYKDGECMSVVDETGATAELGQPFSVLIVGAGPGGICTAAMLTEISLDDLLILEKSEDIGGTWFNNRYPGLACDVCADHYSYSFFQDFDWSRPYPRPQEYRDYLISVVDHFGIRSKIKLNTAVSSAHWDEEESVWIVADSQGRSYRARVLVGAVGMFNESIRPEIAGLDTFSGPSIHTAEWPAEAGGLVDGKSVGVIGSAASAIQLVPAIAPLVGHLDVFQRTPNWVFPKGDVVYSEEERAERRRDPSLRRSARQQSFDLVNTLGDFNNLELMADLRGEAMKNIASVTDQRVRDQLMPRLPIGAQRPLLSSEYYETFNRENVRLVTTPITEITTDSIVTADGEHHRADVLVLATGYAAQKFLSVIDVFGRDGVALRELWKDGAYAYLGIAVERFPNLFMMYGPNTNGGSIIDKLETQAQYIVRKVAHIVENDIAALEVRAEVVEEYNQRVQAGILKMNAWQVEEGSKYYRAANGRVVTQCPFSVTEYDSMTRIDDLGAFDMRTRSWASG